MTEELYKIHTYDPNPYGGEISNRNWFNANQIASVEKRDEYNHPGGSTRVFSRIGENRFDSNYPAVYLRSGKTKQDKVMGSNTHDYGSRWTMVEGGGVDEMIGADEAAKLIAGPVLSKDEGWTVNNKGFIVDYFGWHPSAGNWYQKYNWELYNSSENRLSLPVKGISFTIRHPHEEDMFAVNGATNYNTSHISRAEQVAIDRIYGLWYSPDRGKYLCIEMTINGNNHAPSAHPDIAGTKYHQEYWFVRSNQGHKGNITHFSEFGKWQISAWVNEKIVEKSFFCGIAVSNVVNHAATQGSPHSYQMGHLSPIPFHIDRTGMFRAVYGGFTTADNNSGRSISTQS